MSDALSEAHKLYAEALNLPRATRARADMLDAAARLAEAGGDEDLCFRVRYAMIDAALDAGDVQRSLLAFAYCLAVADARPEAHPESQLHWRYKWVLEWAPRFAEVSRAQIGELLRDVEQRFLRRNIGQNALAKLRARAAYFLGDTDDMARHFERWKITPRDTLSDCRVCDLDEEVMLLEAMGRSEQALHAADTLIQTQQRCQEVPHLTYARVLPMLLAAGKREQAVAFHRRGYPMLKTLKHKLVGHVGPHLVHTAVVGETGRGLRILRETLEAAAEHGVADSRLSYFLGAEVLLERVARGTQRVHIALPKALGGEGVSSQHDAAELRQRFAREVDALVRAFDARNGNARTTQLAAHMRGFCALDLSAGHEPEEA
jgi:hypothetical protein